MPNGFDFPLYSSFDPGSFGGDMPPAPPPVVALPLPVAAPTLGLNLDRIILIVSGGIGIRTAMNVNIQRR